MKVVGVIASPHEEGNGALLTREALRAAREAGAEVSEVFLPRCRIEFCKACGTCLRAGSCPIADDYEQVRGLLEEAQGVILSTPAYAEQPNARLKNLLDRLGQLAFLTSFFGGKYLAGIVTASRSPKGALKQVMALARGSVFQRARVSGSLGVALGGRHVRDMPEALEKARALGRRMVEDIRRGRSYPLQNLGTRVMNGILMRPLMARSITDNRNAMPAVHAELVRKGYLRPAAEEIAS